MTTIKFKPHPKLADEYASLKAEQAKLAKREKALKEALLKMNSDVIEGNFARVTISHIDPSMILDTKAAVELLEEWNLPVPKKEKAGSVRFSVHAQVADAKLEVA